MYELEQVGANTYYINCPAKIGVYLDGADAYLIDSGNDTHSNADHIGGNKYLQGQTDCKIYARGIERDFTEHPILEPSFLYGGYPCKDLRHKFLLAQESKAEYLDESVLPGGMEMIPLPGHFFDMVGFRTPDNVVFLADCLSSAETLEKYKIGFIYDVGAYLKTLEAVEKMQAEIFVPAHAEAAETIAPLARLNIEKVLGIAEKITGLCREPLTFEEILKKLFDDYSLKMNFEQYVLVGSTVRSYLAWLKDEGKLSAEFEENRLLWRTV